MTVSEGLGAALTARRWWAGPDEPILWAVWQVGQLYRVRGLDEDGFEEKSFGEKVESAMASVGNAALYTLGAAMFGGGDDRGNAPTRRSEDLTIVGPGPECMAMRLDNTDHPPGFVSYRQLWVMTPARVGVLIPRSEAQAQASSTGGSSERAEQRRRGRGGVGRALIGRTPESFGDNEPGEPLRDREVAPWLELPLSEISDFSAVGDTRFPEQVRHCALQLADGSGFVLNGKTARGAQHMVDAMRGGWGLG